jgi:hypothetical protein
MCLADYSHNHASLFDSFTCILNLEYTSLRRATRFPSASAFPTAAFGWNSNSQGDGIVIIVISEHLDVKAASIAACEVVKEEGIKLEITERS